MRDYSFSSQMLHRLFLESNFVKSFLFNIEKGFVSKKVNISVDQAVFVTGMARSGSTLLLNSIYETGRFASPTYLDMPFILGPNIWCRLSGRIVNYRSMPRERSHGDRMIVDFDSPEAFEESFWLMNEVGVSDFETFIKLYLIRYLKNRYLSKNNQNIRRIGCLLSLNFPKVVIVPFRKPLSQAISLRSQHLKFLHSAKIENFEKKYFQMLGHTEFGPAYKPMANSKQFCDPSDLNHWIEQWCNIYEDLFENYRSSSDLHFACYETFSDIGPRLGKVIGIDKLNVPYENRDELLIEEDVDSAILQKANDLYGLLRGLAI